MSRQEKPSVVLFGGNRNLFALAQNLILKNYTLHVFTEDFHLGMKINECGSLKQNLDDNAIPYVTRKKLTRESVAEYIEEGTIGFSLSAAWIFRRDVIDLFKGRLYNYHQSRLPKERGAGGYSWRILSRNREGGLSIHKLDEGIDTGDIVWFKEFVYPSECCIPADFADYEASIEDEFLLDFFYALRRGDEIHAGHQNEACSTYWPRLSTALHGYLNWGWDVDEIGLFINAFDDPYDGAMTFLHDNKVHLKKCVIQTEEGRFHSFQAGLVFRKYDESIFIAAKGGALAVREVVTGSGEDILKAIKVGDRFATPQACLEGALVSKSAF